MFAILRNSPRRLTSIKLCTTCAKHHRHWSELRYLHLWPYTRRPHGFPTSTVDHFGRTLPKGYLKAVAIHGLTTCVVDSFFQHRIVAQESFSTTTYSNKLPCFWSYCLLSSPCFNTLYQLFQLQASRDKAIVRTYSHKSKSVQSRSMRISDL